jgi:Mrp family chromosome partitioning ATPase
VQARPSLELGFLNGFDTPQLYQKLPNTMRVGGGVDPLLGDFYTMDQEFKGLLVMGGTQGDGRSTVSSTGQAA